MGSPVAFNSNILDPAALARFFFFFLSAVSRNSQFRPTLTYLPVSFLSPRITWDGQRLGLGNEQFNSIPELITFLTGGPTLEDKNGTRFILEHPYPAKVKEFSVYDEVRFCSGTQSQFLCAWGEVVQQLGRRILYNSVHTLVFVSPSHYCHPRPPLPQVSVHVEWKSLSAQSEDPPNRMSTSVS